MSKSDDPVPALARLPSGISSLDDILHGGFLEGGVYILQGSPTGVAREPASAAGNPQSSNPDV